MEPFRQHTGIVIPLDRVNVDTDQIIPKQFLKRIERTGFGQFLFNDWRFTPDGKPNPEFILNAAALQGRKHSSGGEKLRLRLLAEHAPWALGDYGFRAVIAPSFADIFSNNCGKNGLLTVVLDRIRSEQADEARERDRRLPAHHRS